MIETSGGTLSLLSSINAGRGGIWLIDPYDIIIDATVAGYINTALNASTNVEISTANSSNTIGSNSVSSISGNGNISIRSAINATAGSATLTFIATTIELNADVTTRGAQTYNGDILLASNSTVTSTNGDVIINGSVRATTYPVTGYLSLTGTGGYAIDGVAQTTLNATPTSTRAGTLSYASGIYTWLPSYTFASQYLVVGSGGAGGANNGGGGGGGGVIINSSYAVGSGTTYSIVVGTVVAANAGGYSSLTSGGVTVTANGGTAGGGGGNFWGGSGGTSGSTVVSGVTTSVHVGGNAVPGSCCSQQNGSSGGGSAGNGTYAAANSNNGLGTSSSITGTPVEYGQGGNGSAGGNQGAAIYTPGTGGPGGAGNYGGNTTANNGVVIFQGRGFAPANYTLTINSGTGSTAITGAVTNILGITINSSNISNSIGGIISGGTSVTKQGTGLLTLNGLNTYTGGTTVTAGTLQAGSATAFGASSSAISVASGASLDLNGQVISNTNAATIAGSGVSSNGAITNSSSTAASYAGTVAMSAASSIGTSGGNLTIGGVISGAYAIIINAGASQNGTVVFSNTNTYGTTTLANATVIEGGTLSISADANLGAVSNAATAVALNGGTLQGTASFTLSATRGVTLGTGGGGLAATSSNTLTVAGVVAGSNALTINGANQTGTVALSSATNSYSGNTTITSGKMQISGAGKLGSGTYSGTISNSGTFQYSSSAAQTLSGAISGGGNLIKDTSSSSTLTLSVSNSYSGGTSVQSGIVKAGNASAFGSGDITVGANANSLGTIDLNGLTISNNLILNGGSTGGAVTNSSTTAATASGSVTIGSATSIDGANTLNFTGIVNAGTNGIAFVGAGTYSMNNASNTLATIATSSTPVAGLTIANSSTLTIGSVTVNSTTYSGLAVAGNLTINAPLNINGNITTGGTQAYNGVVNITGTSVLATYTGGTGTTQANKAITFAATVDGPGALTITNGSATTTFGDAVGATTALASLSITGTGSTTLGGNVTTTGIQSYGGNVALNAENINLNTNNAAVTITGTVSSVSAPGSYNGVLALYTDGTYSYNGTSAVAASTNASQPTVLAAGGGTLVYVSSVFTWTPSITKTGARYLVVGGGGGGGSDWGGGGGAGGFLQGTVDISANTSYSITVGAGGTPTANRNGSGVCGPNANCVGNTGGMSTAFGYSAYGGGGGGTYVTPGTAPAGTYGSGGGGGGGNSGAGNYSLGTAGQGNNGGNGQNGYLTPAFAPSNGGGGGGGGGSATAGASPTVSAGVVTGGKGGNGTASDITGSSVYYAAGGGGGVYGGAAGSTAGLGGLGGGGNGSIGVNASNATSYGSGGGGGGSVRLGGAGSAGIAVVNTGPTTSAGNSLVINSGTATATITGGTTDLVNLTINSSSASSIITGAITGATNLVKTCSGTCTAASVTSTNRNTVNGTLTLVANNSYTGTTTITSGTIQVGNNTTTGTLGSGALTNNGNLAFYKSAALTYSTNLTGTGSVSQNGSGVLTLSGNNSYQGGTFISDSKKIIVTSANALGGANSGLVTIGASGILDLQYSGTVSIGSLYMNTGASITNSANTSNLAVSGVSTLLGTVTTAGTQTYTGAATVNGSTTLNTTNAAINFGSTISSGVTVARALQLLGGGSYQYGAGSIATVGASAVTLIDGATLSYASGAYSWTPSSNTTADYLIVAGGGGGSLGTNGVYWGPGAGGGQVLTGSNTWAAGTTYTITVGAGGASPSVTGGGANTTAARANTGYDGGIGGTSIISGSGLSTITALGGNGSNHNSGTGATSGSGQLGAVGSTVASLAGGAGGGAGGAGSGLTGGSGVTSSITGTSVEYGIGGCGMNGTACANATPAANSGRGAASIIGSVAPAGGSGVVAISIARDFVPQSLILNTGSAAVTLNNNVADVSLAINSTSASSAISGVISGAVSLTYNSASTYNTNGNGVITLANANTYTGGTTVASGKVVLGNNSSLGTGAVTVGTAVTSLGTVDLRGYSVGNNFTIYGGDGTGAIINSSSGTTSTISGTVSLDTVAASLGGAGNLTISGVVNDSSRGIAFIGTGNFSLANASNTIAIIGTISTGIGSLTIVDNTNLTIGSVTVNSVAYSGIKSSGAVSITATASSTASSAITSTVATNASGNVSFTATSTTGNGIDYTGASGTITGAAVSLTGTSTTGIAVKATGTITANSLSVTGTGTTAATVVSLGAMTINTGDLTVVGNDTAAGSSTGITQTGAIADNANGGNITFRSNNSITQSGTITLAANTSGNASTILYDNRYGDKTSVLTIGTLTNTGSSSPVNYSILASGGAIDPIVSVSGYIVLDNTYGCTGSGCNPVSGFITLGNAATYATTSAGVTTTGALSAGSYVTLKGISSGAAGVVLGGTVSAASGDITIIGASTAAASKAIDMPAISSLYAPSGNIILTGTKSTASTGAVISIVGTSAASPTAISASGYIQITAYAPSSNTYVAYFSYAVLAAGGDITISAAGGGGNGTVYFTNSPIYAGGNLAIQGAAVGAANTKTNTAASGFLAGETNTNLIASSLADATIISGSLSGGSVAGTILATYVAPVTGSSSQWLLGFSDTSYTKMVLVTLSISGNSVMATPTAAGYVAIATFNGYTGTAAQKINTAWAAKTAMTLNVTNAATAGYGVSNLVFNGYQSTGLAAGVTGSAVSSDASAIYLGANAATTIASGKVNAGSYTDIVAVGNIWMAGTSSGAGINVVDDYANITSTSGSIRLIGVVSGSGSVGVRLRGASIVTTQNATNGVIDILGTSTNTTSGWAVYMDGTGTATAPSVVNSAKTLNIIGYAAGAGGTYGIDTVSYVLLKSAGNMLISGSTPNGTNSYAIDLTNTIIKSGGALTIQGATTATVSAENGGLVGTTIANVASTVAGSAVNAGLQHAVRINGTTTLTYSAVTYSNVVAAGNVWIAGQSPSSTGGYYGLYIYSSIISTGGGITLIGTTAGSGGMGVRLGTNADLIAQDTTNGNIAVYGTASNATTGYGIYIDGGGVGTSPHIFDAGKDLSLVSYASGSTGTFGIYSTTYGIFKALGNILVSGSTPNGADAYNIRLDNTALQANGSITMQGATTSTLTNANGSTNSTGIANVATTVQGAAANGGKQYAIYINGTTVETYNNVQYSNILAGGDIWIAAATNGATGGYYGLFDYSSIKSVNGNVTLIGTTSGNGGMGVSLQTNADVIAGTASGQLYVANTSGTALTAPVMISNSGFGTLIGQISGTTLPTLSAATLAGYNISYQGGTTSAGARAATDIALYATTPTTASYIIGVRDTPTSGTVYTKMELVTLSLLGSNVYASVQTAKYNTTALTTGTASNILGGSTNLVTLWNAGTVTTTSNAKSATGYGAANLLFSNVGLSTTSASTGDIYIFGTNTNATGGDGVNIVGGGAATTPHIFDAAKTLNIVGYANGTSNANAIVSANNGIFKSGGDMLISGSTPNGTNVYAIQLTNTALYSGGKLTMQGATTSTLSAQNGGLVGTTIANVATTVAGSAVNGGTQHGIYINGTAVITYNGSTYSDNVASGNIWVAATTGTSAGAYYGIYDYSAFTSTNGSITLIGSTGGVSGLGVNLQATAHVIAQNATNGYIYIYGTNTSTSGGDGVNINGNTALAPHVFDAGKNLVISGYANGTSGANSIYVTTFTLFKSGGDLTFSGSTPRGTNSYGMYLYNVAMKSAGTLTVQGATTSTITNANGSSGGQTIANVATGVVGSAVNGGSQHAIYFGPSATVTYNAVSYTGIVADGNIWIVGSTAATGGYHGLDIRGTPITSTGGSIVLTGITSGYGGIGIYFSAATANVVAAGDITISASNLSSTNGHGLYIVGSTQSAPQAFIAGGALTISVFVSGTSNESYYLMNIDTYTLFKSGGDMIFALNSPYKASLATWNVRFINTVINSGGNLNFQGSVLSTLSAQNGGASGTTIANVATSAANTRINNGANYGMLFNSNVSVTYGSPTVTYSGIVATGNIWIGSLTTSGVQAFYNNSNITSTAGAVTIWGTVTAASANGVYLNSGTISSAGLLTLTGTATGTSTTVANNGVYMTSSATLTSAGGIAIASTGTTGGANAVVNLNGAVTNTGTTGTGITISSTADTSTAAITNSGANGVRITGGYGIAAGTTTGGNILALGTITNTGGVVALSMAQPGASPYTIEGKVGITSSNVSMANIRYSNVGGTFTNPTAYSTGNFIDYRAGVASYTITVSLGANYSQAYGTAYNSSTATTWLQNNATVTLSATPFGVSSTGVKAGLTFNSSIGNPAVNANIVQAATVIKTGSILSADGVTVTVSGTPTYTITKATLTITDLASSTTYNGTSTYAGLVNTAGFSLSGLVSSIGGVNTGDTVTSVTQTIKSGSTVGSGTGITGTDIAQYGSFNTTPSLAVGSGLANYNISYVGVGSTVAKAALTITAASDIKTYGATTTNAGLVYTTSGGTATAPAGSGLGYSITSGSLLGVSDTLTGVTLTSAGGVATAAVMSGASAASYSIVPSAASGTGLSNYTITYANGAMSVNPRALAITATNQTSSYGTAFSVGTGKTAFSSSGLQNSETIGSITTASTGSSTSATVGTYALIPGAATGGTFTASNYTIAYANGILTVGTKALTITASQQTGDYGVSLNLGTSQYTSSGLINGNSISGVTLLYANNATVAPTVNAGTYSGGIVPSAATGSGLSNYAITYVNGNLVINKATLTVTPNAKSVNYDGATLNNGTYSVAIANYTVTGYQNSDNATSAPVTLTGIIGFNGSTTTTVQNAATYALTVGTLAGTSTNSNYQVSFANTNSNAYVINKATVSIAASKTYDGSATFVVGTPGTTLTVATGIVGQTLTLSGSADANSANVTGVTSLPTTGLTLGNCSGGGCVGAASNYQLPVSTSSVSITPKTISVRLADKSKTYDASTSTILTAGSSGSAGDYAYTGFVGSEGAYIAKTAATYNSANASLSGLYTIASTVSIALVAGDFTAKVGTLLSNYTLPSSASGNGTIAKATLTMTAADAAKFVGQVDPSFTYTITGLVGGDTTAVLSGAAVARSNASTNTAGYVDSLVPSATAANYTINPVNGVFTIVAQGQLLIRVGNSTSVYGTLSGTANLSAVANVTASYCAIGSSCGAGDIVNLSMTAPTGASVSWLAVDAQAPQGRYTFDVNANVPSGSVSGAGYLKVGAYTVTPSSTVTTIGAVTNYSTSYPVLVNSGTISVTPLTLTVSPTGGIAPTKQYDTSATLSGATLTPTNKVGIDAISLVGYGSYGTANAGSTTYTINNIVLSGADAENYSVAGVTVSGATSISQAPVTVSGLSAANKVYDTNRTAVLSGAGATVIGLLGSDTASVSGTVAGTFSQANVGTGLTVTPVVGSSGLVLDNANYYISGVTSSLTADITAAPITVTAAKVYDGSKTVTNSGISVAGIGGQTLVLSAGTGTLSNPNVGSAALVALNNATLGNGTGLASNYTLVNPSFSTVTITPAAITVAPTAAVKVYDTNMSVVGASVVPGLSLVSGALYYNSANSSNASSNVVQDSLSGGTFLYDNANAGTGKTLSVSGISMLSGTTSVVGNYSITYAATSTSSITKAPLTISGLSASNKQYDAGRVAAIGGTPTAVGVLTNASNIQDTITVAIAGTAPSGLFSQSDVGTGLVVTPNTTTSGGYTTMNGITLGGASANNYYVVGVNSTLTAAITPAPITVTAVKTYDGSNTVTTSDITVAGVAGQTLTLSAGTATLSNPNVGTAALIGLNGASLANGAGGIAGSASNYTVSNPTFGSVTITPANIVFTATNAEKVYDTTTGIVGATTIPGATIASGTLYTNASTGLTDAISGGTFAYATAAAGSNKQLNVSGVGILNGSTDASANYNISYVANTTSAITKAPVTIAGLTISNKVYDTLTDAQISLAGATVAGLIGADATAGVTVGGSVTGSFASANVGNGIAVSPTLTSVTLSNPNYTITGVTSPLSANITPAPITLTASKIYDGSNTVALSGLIAAGVGGETLTLSAGSATLSNPNVGTATLASLNNAVLADGISGTIGLASNYTVLNPVMSTVTITPANITISSTDAVKVYDATTGVVGASTAPLASVSTGTLFTNASTGLVDTLSGGTFAYSNANAGSSNKTLNVGNVAIMNGSTNISSNYNITYQDNTTSTITPAPLTFVVSSSSGSYGTAASLAGASAILSGFLSSADQSNITPTIAVSSGGSVITLANNTPAGIYQMVVTGISGTGSSNYQIVSSGSNSGTLTINKASLTITANAQSTTYGSALSLGTSAFTYGILVSGDTVDAVTLTSVIGNAAASATVPGTAYAGIYSITPSAATGTGIANYAITYVTNTLTIDRKAISVVADNASMTYGATTLPTLTYQTVSGLVNGDSMAGLLATTATPYNGTAGSASNVRVGGYPISQGTVSAGSNYTINYTGGTLTVDPASLTITASTQSTTYGSPLVLSQTAYTSSGLTNGDSVAGASIKKSSSTIVAGNVDAGTYAGTLDVSAATGNGLSNYNITYASGDLVVGKKVLIVSAVADAKFVTTADNIGFNGVLYSGFVNGDTASSLLSPATVSADRSSMLSVVSPAGVTTSGLLPSAGTEPAATYANALVAAGASSNNYTFTYVKANLTVVPADGLIVQAGTQSVTYGNSPNYSGATAQYLFNGAPTSLPITIAGNAISITDGAGAVITGNITPNNAVISSSGNLSVGNYSLGVSNFYNQSLNFNSMTVIGGLTITPKTVALSSLGISGVTKVYDGNTNMTNLALSANPSALVAGDVLNVTGAGSFDSKNVASNSIGYTVAVALAGADAANYVISGSPIYTGTNGTITQLNSVTYTGSAGGLWVNPSNWTTTGTSTVGAIPDLSNVAHVILPAGSSVVYDDSVQGPVTSAVANSGNLNFNLTADTTVPMSISGTGIVTISGAGIVTLTGNSSYTGATILNAGTKLIAGANNAIGAGSITSNGTALNPAIFSTGGGVVLPRLNIAGGTTEIWSDIATAGTQTYSGSLLIGSSNTHITTISSNNANITMNGTLDGSSNKSESLVINAGTGTVTFADSIGSIARLNNLTVTGSSIYVLADILTGMTQTYNGAVYIGDASYVGRTPVTGFLFTDHYKGYFQYIAGTGVSASTIDYLNTNPVYVRTMVSEDPSITYNGTVNDTVANTHTLLVAAVAPTVIPTSSGYATVNAGASINFNAAVGGSAPLYSLNTQLVVANVSPSNATSYIGTINLFGGAATYSNQTYRANLMTARTASQPGGVVFSVWDPAASVNFNLPIQTTANSGCSTNCGQVNLQNPNSLDSLTIYGSTNFTQAANLTGQNNWGNQLTVSNALGYVAPPPVIPPATLPATQQIPSIDSLSGGALREALDYHADQAQMFVDMKVLMAGVTVSTPEEIQAAPKKAGTTIKAPKNGDSSAICSVDEKGDMYCGEE
ncbi:YDG domain-containing protein [Polynucleobacter sp. JS-Polo-80-F4]|uniref:YDG domain-containing protein n=1 Tax=Polynucleobacter sp. JS-Polo-80-F4 TaxID=2576918 RepID=UPI001C0DB8B7|nr:YDG domain-containing protein [Polynucleobacter sp. JS-Polo-80-F4]